jgi:ribosomal protein S18 acetylase RimI-like enzyme
MRSIIEIHQIDQDNLFQINLCDNSFLVEEKLRLYTKEQEILYSSVPINHFVKSYPPEEIDYSSYIDNPEKNVYFAFIEGQLAGQIILRKNWNGYAYIEDIAVDCSFRRQGVGQRLMVQAVEWARSKALPGIMLETSNVNVPACKFYAHFGFKLGGFDRYLYQAVMPGTQEVAMYWYLTF